MLKGAHILTRVDTSYLDKSLFDENRLLKIMPSSFYAEIPQEHLAIWCHDKGIYCLPTTELIEFLSIHVRPFKTIEIGSGNGAIGRALSIPMTDSCYMRSVPEVATYYALTGQPVTKYPEDIIEMDAIKALHYYLPEVVIGSWITHKFTGDPATGGNQYGVDEGQVLSMVDKYIMIGNRSVHSVKPILKIPHSEYEFSWLFSRSLSSDMNVIYVWEKQR